MRGMPLAGMHFIFWSDIMILQSLFLFTSSNSLCPTISSSRSRPHTHTHGYDNECRRFTRIPAHTYTHAYTHTLIFPHWRLVGSSYNILQYTHMYVRKKREGRLCVCVWLRMCVWACVNENLFVMKVWADFTFVCEREGDGDRDSRMSSFQLRLCVFDQPIRGELRCDWMIPRLLMAYGYSCA